MKKFLSITTVVLLLVSTFYKAVAQPAFQDEIQAFKKQDRISPPPKNAILFVGSSSFRKWTDVQTYFHGYTIINRGFGGSVLPDVIRYANDIIIPYRPKQVLIYCGDNDLASSDSITPQTVAGRFKQLFIVIRNALPKTKVSFVSIKPSPSRERLMPKMKQANSLIKSFLLKQKNTSYIDVFNPMLLPNGQPKPDLFLEDKLHMNEKGYVIWQKAIQPFLIK
jgi:lysophospholipase L1-like esterase